MIAKSLMPWGKVLSSTSEGGLVPFSTSEGAPKTVLVGLGEGEPRAVKTSAGLAWASTASPDGGMMAMERTQKDAVKRSTPESGEARPLTNANPRRLGRDRSCGRSVKDRQQRGRGFSSLLQTTQIELNTLET
jgi:hypothetical protein